MNVKCCLVGLLCVIGCQLRAQIKIVPDTIQPVSVSDTLVRLKPRPFVAGATVFGTNMGVWAFDRFVSATDYSRISFQSISNNLKTGFVWDEDMFTTNLFAHPYHGGLYFNAGRSNGLGFWQSVPCTMGGSLMWEFGMENEPAAINDFMATSIGGVCLGEITFRISDLLIDERSFGVERFGREFLSLLISPVNGFNRILSGRAMRVSHRSNHVVEKRPAIFYATVGHRIMADNLKDKNDVVNTMSYDLGLYYGDPFGDDNEKPYDAFMLKISGNILDNQPLIHRLNALGMLYSVDVSKSKSKNHFVFGAFQHFNFYHSNIEKDHQLIYPYKISEAASVGPGLLYKRDVNARVKLLGMAHLSAILLGASQTDHFRAEKRDYNMGSGFSSKVSLELEMKRKARLYFTSEDYRIYSWMGSKVPNSSEFVSNSQGDIGNASLTVLRIGFQYTIKKHFLFSTETSYNYRRSYYKYYDVKVVQHNVEENKVSIGYLF
ncbi:MAG: hypothetical protein RIS29_1763 [Bacteroidota bacterium]|jgi:hypothetical protein